MSGNLARESSNTGCHAQNKRCALLQGCIPLAWHSALVWNILPVVPPFLADLVVLNLIFLIMACALLAVASWGQRNSSYLKAIIPAAGFNVAIAAGSILLIISISGVIGTVGSFYKFGRWLLVFYNWILLLLILLEFIAAGILLAATGTLNSYTYGSWAQNNIQSFVNSSYSSCCTDVNSAVPGVVNITGSCLIAQFISNATCANQDTFYLKFQSVVSSHLVPVTAVLFIAIVLQVINIFITYCVIRVARKRYLKHVEETEDAYNHSDYDKQKKRPPPRRPSLEAQKHQVDVEMIETAPAGTRKPVPVKPTRGAAVMTSGDEESGEGNDATLTSGR